MSQTIVQVLTGALGSLGFALCSHTRAKLLPATALGGALGWGVYLITARFTASLFLCSLVGAMAVYIWSEVMARSMRAPVTVFLAPGIIPLLPGSYLYYTMLALMTRQAAEFQQQGICTLLATMGVACGVVITSILAGHLLHGIERFRARRSIAK